jgi:hypothetical protein
MYWAESSRLPKKIRESRERFEMCLSGMEEGGGKVTSSKREDTLLDVLPLLRRIDKSLRGKMKRNLDVLCAFPLWGRGAQIVIEEENVEIPVKVHGGGWLEDDDIED